MSRQKIALRSVMRKKAAKERGKRRLEIAKARFRIEALRATIEANNRPGRWLPFF